MKKRLISGIKPTGDLHLGSYIGAIRNFVAMQDDYDMTVFIANLHCITLPIDPNELKGYLRDQVLFYLACGLDPSKATIFLQSDVMEHAQLAYILSCITGLGELNRQTQFKDKKDSGMTLTAGFYTYPTLMAADILIYNVDGVPVGDDQKQHVELTRDLAQRFNQRFGETFVVPEVIIPKVGKRIMSLQEPSKKMSKSDHTGEKGIVYLKDSPKTIRKKIMSAVTDSDMVVKYDVEHKPGISNLLTIYAALKNVSIAEAELEFKDAQYGAFKKAVADVVVAEFEGIQARYRESSAQDVVEGILHSGASKMRVRAQETLHDVQKRMGLEWI